MPQHPIRDGLCIMLAANHTELHGQIIDAYAARMAELSDAPAEPQPADEGF